MLKYWTKNRFLFDIVSGIALSLLFCFAFVSPSYGSYSRAYAENTIYLNTKIDYQVPNPSKDQLGEIKELTFVDDVFGYYFTKTNISGGESAKINLLMSDTMNSVGMTMFGPRSLKTKTIQADNAAFIDEKAAKALNAGLGDRINISIASSKIDYVVCGIYESTNAYPDGAVLIEFAGEAKITYEANASSKAYSGAFIDASNEQECKQYLNSYIPMGRLKDRSEFSTDEAYNLYNNSILSGNYSNEISDFCSQRPMAVDAVNTEKSGLTKMTFIGAAAVGVAFLAINEILRFRKSENHYFSALLKNKKSISTYRWLSFVIGLSSYVAGTVVISLLTSELSVVIIPLALSAGLFTVTHILNLIQDRSYLKK